MLRFFYSCILPAPIHVGFCLEGQVILGYHRCMEFRNRIGDLVHPLNPHTLSGVGLCPTVYFLMLFQLSFKCLNTRSCQDTPQKILQQPSFLHLQAISPQDLTCGQCLRQRCIKPILSTGSSCFSNFWRVRRAAGDAVPSL